MADEDVIAPEPLPEEPEPEIKVNKIDPQGWMLSFGDLVSLMLVFFVMLFAMSTLEQEEFEAVVSALAQQFNPTTTTKESQPSVELDIPKMATAEANNLDYLRALISDKLSGDPMLDDIRMHQLHDRLVVSLPADQMFRGNSAQLSDNAGETIARVGTVIQFLGNRVHVNGHTDPQPITNVAYQSNWELSLSRAIAVADELRRSGFGSSVLAFGLADGRFADISLDLPVAERYRRARRVDIVIRRDAASGASP